MPSSWGNDGRGVQFGLNISHGRQVTDLLSWETMGNALSNPELWLGALAGAAMIVAAIHLRRHRELAD
jgi:hypothetical protein